jgi:hypothetical protein
MARKIVGYAANNAVGVLALFVALCGVSYAATGGFAGGGTLKACVNEEGAIRLLKSGKHCKRGQKAVSWNQAGPAGPQGATGATGAAGATGPIGLTGASGQPPNIMWAQIDEDGVIEAGHGVTGVHDTGKSPYKVTFERPVDHCALVVTQNGKWNNRVATGAFVEEEDPSTVVVPIKQAEPPFEHTIAGFSIIAVC